MRKKKATPESSHKKKKRAVNSSIAPFASTPQRVSAEYSIQVTWDGGQGMTIEWDPDIPPKAKLRAMFESGAYIRARDAAVSEIAAATGLRIAMVTP